MRSTLSSAGINLPLGHNGGVTMNRKKSKIAQTRPNRIRGFIDPYTLGFIITLIGGSIGITVNDDEKSIVAEVEAPLTVTQTEH